MSTPLRLRVFQIALSLLCIASIGQSLLGLVRPELVAAHRARMHDAMKAGTGVDMGGEAVPAFELYVEGAVCLAAVGLALALLWRAGNRPSARALALLLATAFFPAMAVAQLGVPYPAVVSIHNSLLWVYVGAFLRFAALFPNPLTRVELEAADAMRAARRGRTPRAVGRARALLLDGRAVWAMVAAGAALTMLGGALRQPLLSALLLPLLLWAMVRGVGFLRASYAVADPVGQNRILWVVQGFYSMLWILVVMVGMIGYGMVLGARTAAAGKPLGDATLPAWMMVASNVTQSLSILFLIVCLAFAIFFQGALDPRLALQRTTIYATLAVVGALLFGVVENFASSFLADVLHLSEGLGAAVAGAAVAGALGPIRGWITRVVESRLASATPDEPFPGDPAPA